MELIRRNSDYALRSLAYMAGLPYGKRFTISSIAKEQNIPATFLRKIFQKLSLNNIVDSHPGPGGGFYLLKKPYQLSLKEILEAVQGEISLSDCLFKSNVCSRAKTCSIRTGLSPLQKKLIDLLDKYTLDDFLDKVID